MKGVKYNPSDHEEIADELRVVIAEMITRDAQAVAESDSEKALALARLGLLRGRQALGCLLDRLDDC
ncbi:MAG: hypothetical protein LBK99_10905 [Opitutaceae bacterium]|jgi:hypothetical protein|nr:hypothetical protein [Opitutaceae bacterium]